MGRGGNNSLFNQISNPKESIVLANRRILLPEKGFNFRFDETGKYVLVWPEKGTALKAEQWNKDTRWFRSLMFNRSTGKIVSVGFPKFFNYGEHQHDTQTLENHLQDNQEVSFTEKMDGSLIIRSVIDNKVFLRTRGTLDKTVHSQTAMKVIADKYPVLADPDFMNKESLLFELISPNPELKIVIDYKEDDLVLLGKVDHRTLEQASLSELNNIGKENNLNPVQAKHLPTDPEQLIATIDQWTSCEGIVARYDNQQEMLKIKSADYLLRHRLRYALSAKVIKNICLERNIRQLEDFEGYLTEQGGDWEIASDSKPLVEKFLRTRSKTESTLSELSKQVSEKARQYPQRADFARQYASKLVGPQKGVAFSLLDGKKEQAFNSLLKYNLEQAFSKEEQQEQALEGS
jgi:hypothetical protein